MSDATYFKKLEEAGRQIGMDAVGLMRWVLRFSRQELSSLSAEELLDVRFELEKFGQSTALVGQGRDSFPSPVAPGGRGILDCNLPNEQTVRSYQHKLRHLLQQVVEEGGVSFRTPPMDHHLTWSREVGDLHDLTYVVTAADEPDGPYTYVLIQLLVSHGKYLRRCDECTQIFLAERSNQTYCSKTCQTRAGTRRYRHQHGLITGRRRGRPRKEKCGESQGGDKSRRHRSSL